MNTLTADKAIQAVLSKLNEPTEICDASGKIVGYFTPANEKDASLYAHARAHFDKGEMKRRKASGERGLTTPELLKHLESLGQS